MKRKIYTSQSVPHFSVGGTRIAFISLSMHGSYFETTDENLQTRLENHPWFGDKFKLSKTEEEGGPLPEEKKDTKVDEEEVMFATLSDAKEYLAGRFGIVGRPMYQSQPL